MYGQYLLICLHIYKSVSSVYLSFLTRILEGANSPYKAFLKQITFPKVKYPAITNLNYCAPQSMNCLMAMFSTKTQVCGDVHVQEEGMNHERLPPN